VETRRIAGTAGVEWLSVDAVGQSGGDTEAQWIGAAMTLRHGGSESRWHEGARIEGAAGRSHGDAPDRSRGNDVEAW
jgi:hypothetical protein